MTLQHFFAETGADLADRLIGFSFCVIARQEECAIYVSALSFPVVTPDNNEIQRVANAGEIILFHLFIELINGNSPAAVASYLQPVHTPPARLVIACITLEHFHHQSLATIFHTLVKEGLDFFHSLGV